MKKLFLLLILCGFLSAQTADKTENEISSFLKTEINVEADLIKSSFIKSVFNSTFYTVKLFKNYKGNDVFEECLYVKKMKKIIQLNKESDIVNYIRPSFKLNSESSAKKLQKALTALFGGRPSDQEIIQQDKKWILIQKKWFSEKSGYEVLTDNTGVIIKITSKENITL